jgi:nucleoside-diphosphate-sugar epimerase
VLSPDDARARPDDTPFIPMSSARLRSVTGWRPAIPFRRTLADLFASWSGEIPVS